MGSTACAGKKDWWDPDVDQTEFTGKGKKNTYDVKKVLL